MDMSPSGVYTGTGLFNVFLNYIGGGIIKFADDTKLNGAADTPEGWNIIHMDWDKLMNQLMEIS